MIKNQNVALAARKRDSRQMTVSRPELLLEGSDLAFRHMVHDIMAFAARMQENRARVASYVGLSGQQYTILITIAHHQDQEGFGIIQVAEHLRLSGAFVTIEVNKLVEAGLVRKRANPMDRRRVLLTILPKARELLDRVSRIQRPSHDTIFGGLSADEFRMLRNIIPRLVEGADQSLKLLDFLTSDGAQISALR
jgi:DNA-binding MarR family transcriptional regulator